MKDILKEYYGINVDYGREYNQGFVFFVNGDYYYLCRCFFDETEVNKEYELYLLLKQRNILLHDFIFNLNGKLISKEYVLFKMNHMISDINFLDMQKMLVKVDFDLKDDFYSLWINKIDYLELQLLELSNEEVINYSFDYFVGIAEMLLSFYKENVVVENDKYIVHRTLINLSTIDFYNPLNIIIGNRYKDIAGYIKVTNDWNMLYNLLNEVNDVTKFFLFVRLSFPFYYFNLINDYFTNSSSIEKINEIVKNIDVYEEYLYKLEKTFGINLFNFIKKDN